MRKRNQVIRERDRLIFQAKSERKPTHKICELLDKREIPILPKWEKQHGYRSWTEAYNQKARLPIWLFSAIYSQKRKLTQRERDFYFYSARR